MEVFEMMAKRNLDTISFVHDFKTGKVKVEPKVQIPGQYEFIKRILTERGEGHEKMIFHYNPKVNLKVIVAIHDSILGFPLGGTRMRDDYENEAAAIIDAADLAEGMSNKGFWAGTGTSGGKVVIIGDPKLDKTPELLEAYGEFLEKIACIISGEDMNIKSADCSIIARKTKYIAGTREKSGDPSPKTAYGVLLGLRAAIKHLWGRTSFEGITVAIQGITGGVGSNQADYLAREGASLIGSYWEKEKEAKEIAKRLGVKIVPGGKENPYGIFKEKYDILSLNGTGKWLNTRTIMQIPKGTIIGGGANNQLADPRDHLGDLLFQKGIWYLPDFVMNPGGLINVADELEEGGYSEERVMKKIEVVGINIPWILNISKAQKISPHRIADMLPRLFIKEARQRKYGIR